MVRPARLVAQLYDQNGNPIIARRISCDPDMIKKRQSNLHEGEFPRPNTKCDARKLPELREPCDSASS